MLRSRRPKTAKLALTALVLSSLLIWSFFSLSRYWSGADGTFLVAPAYASAVTIVSGPADMQYSTSATFSFTISPENPAECKLDSGVFTACVSPQEYSGLSAGSHTFTVADSTDPASTDTWTWLILSTPTISSLDPSGATAGGTSFTLTVTGTGYGYASVVRWDGTDLSTTYVSVSGLTAIVPAANIASAGSHNITVFNPPGPGISSASVGFTVSSPPVPTGDSGNVTGWMWSRNAGWISMNCSNFGTCNLSSYGVNLEEQDAGGDVPTTADLTGYAWSDDLGWICFGKTCAGVNPESVANYAEWRAGKPPEPDARDFCSTHADCSPLEACGGESYCVPRGRIYGWAKVINMGDRGWIALNCDNDVSKTCGTSDHFIVFDQGKFTLAGGWPVEAGADPDNYHWAWSGNDDGTGLGWIDTSLVFADWAPPGLGRVLRPEGIYEPDIPSLPPEYKAAHRPSTFQITVEGIYCASDHRIECELGLPNGERRFIGRDLGDLAHYGDSVTLEYTVTEADGQNGGVEQNRLWMINACRLAGKPIADMPCAQESDCPAGKICDEEAGFCRKITATSLKKPLYVHANRWTLFNDNEDYYQAIKCYAGFPGQFFQNSTRCDFTGDASFSLAMSKGVPIKRDCHALPDEEGLSDCDDRFCSGISYFCTEHQPTRCVWDEAGGDLLQCSDISYQRGGLCCSGQPAESGSAYNSVVNGLECEYQDPQDGYFDCDCTGEGASFAPDCYAPYYQPGDLCCTVNSEVAIVEPEE